MKKISFLKVVACFFIGASMLASCQKENTPTATDESGAVKYAVDVTNLDLREWGTVNEWLGHQGSLSFLAPQLPTNRSDLFFDNQGNCIVPTGIEVTEKSFVYVTYVGEMASFNNVLGYYYYDPSKGSITDEEIINQVFITDPVTKKITFQNIIYSQTKGLDFGYTFKLTTKEGKEFNKGTVIGFCLMPNSGGNATYNTDDKTTVLPNVKMLNGKPIIIATNQEWNKDEKISHLLGASACDDIVLTFEDLNSAYSSSSDDDYNDLAFVVGDNLNTRHTTKIKAYSKDPRFILPALGENCIRCSEADFELFALTNQLQKLKSNDRDIEAVYDILFKKQDVYNVELPLKESTKLYARLAYINCAHFNTVGWYIKEKGGKSIREQLTGDRKGTIILDKHIIFKNYQGGPGDARIYSEFVELSPTAFSKDDEIGFFIVSCPAEKAQIEYNETGDVVNDFLPIRFTNDNGSDGKNQSQIIVQSACNNVLIAFEDIKETGGGMKSDFDFNDIILNISDNNKTLASSKIALEGDPQGNKKILPIYPLSELNAKFCQYFPGDCPY